MRKNLFNNPNKLALLICLFSLFSVKIGKAVLYLGDTVTIESVALPGQFLIDSAGQSKIAAQLDATAQWVLDRGTEQGEVKAGTFPKLRNVATGKYLGDIRNDKDKDANPMVDTWDKGEFWAIIDLDANYAHEIDAVAASLQKKWDYATMYADLNRRGSPVNDGARVALFSNGSGRFLHFSGDTKNRTVNSRTKIMDSNNDKTNRNIWKIKLISSPTAVAKAKSDADAKAKAEASAAAAQAKLIVVKQNPVVSEDAKIIPTISYGDVVRLTSFPDTKVENGITLHSHFANYDSRTSKSTSGQQQVTGITGEDDNDWWIVSSLDGKEGVVKNDDRISLIHMTTMKCLHTHTDNNIQNTNGWDNTLKSPDNEHREITCFDLDKTNIGNSWTIKIYDGTAPAPTGANWVANKNVVFERYNPNLGNPDYKTSYPEYLWISDKTFSPDGNPQNLQHIVGLNKTPTYLVVADIKNKPNYVYGKFLVEIPVNLPAKWFAEDGKFSTIAIGSTTKGIMLKFGIGLSDGKLYEFNDDSMSDNPWEEFKDINDTTKKSIGQLIGLTTSVDGNLFVINTENKVFKFDFDKKLWSEIKVANQPKLIQISCGNAGTIVAKSAESKLYKLGTKEWVEISDVGEMVVATVKSNIFGLGLNGNVYKHTTSGDWTELASAPTPFIYIAAADTIEENSSIDPKAKPIEKTVIFAIDKDFALWKIVLDEKKWAPVLGKDGKQSTGFAKIVTNGVSHAALDGENDNYHFGNSGIKITANKTIESVTPATTTRTQAIQTGKKSSKTVAKKTVKAKSNVKKAKSKVKLTKSKTTKTTKKTTTKKALPAKKKTVKKATKKPVTKKTTPKTTQTSPVTASTVTNTEASTQDTTTPVATQATTQPAA